MKNRAYSLLTVKSVSEGGRRIKGIATTPAPDRDGDIIEPLGVTFTNPAPLLWQHDISAPVGRVWFDQPTAESVTFEAELPVVAEPGPVRDRVEEAWQSVTSGLVTGVSIGFRPVSWSYLDSGGVRVDACEVFELSLVTIPANVEATIQRVKSLDATGLAAKGKKPGASANAPHAAGKDKMKGNGMSVKQQIAARELKRKSAVDAMAAIADAAAADGDRDMTAEEVASFDEHSAEVEAIDAGLSRLKSLDAMQVAKGAVAAVLPAGAGRGPGGSGRAPVVPGVAKAAEPEPGIRLARYARCAALARKTGSDAVAIAGDLYGARDPQVVTMTKAAVGAMTGASDPALMANVGGIADFVDFLRPQTIVGRFGLDGVPALTEVPFDLPVLMETAPVGAAWVGDGKAIPMSKGSFDRETLGKRKIAALTAVTLEQLRDNSAATERLIRNQMALAIIQCQDGTFIDPTSAGNAARPGSILNGVAALPSAGNDLAAINQDIYALMAKFSAANLSIGSGVWIMSARLALRLSLMKNEFGVRIWPEMHMGGGKLEGLPVIASEHMGDNVALVAAPEVYFADEGEVEIEISTEASLK
ncbi:phage major capsid protein [Paracoccus cavernae]|uniref:Phage major capsid protein n=1 Tax=Paracoccus cavernae TaxID=1571207 RepID=A0ABT8D2G3_9RHOB|nr:phage major capsid protein [Paracoccus cavernae]